MIYVADLLVLMAVAVVVAFLDWHWRKREGDHTRGKIRAASDRLRTIRFWP